MFADSEECVALTLVEFFEIEDVLVKLDRFFDIVDFDRDVIDSVNLDAHGRLYPCGSEMVTRVPEPGRLSIAIVPATRSTARFAIARPSPEPSPLRSPPR